MSQIESRGPAVSRQRVREQLAERLSTVEELDAFCLDYFPEVKRRFTGGMDRLARENLLLEMQDSAEVQAALQRYSGQRFYSRRRLPRWSWVALVPVIGVVLFQVAGPLSRFHSAGSVGAAARVTPLANDANLAGVRFEDPMEFAARAQRLQTAVRIEAKITVSADGREKEVTVILVDTKTAKPISFTHYISPITAAWTNRLSPEASLLFVSIDRTIQQNANAFVDKNIPLAIPTERPTQSIDGGTPDLSAGAQPSLEEGGTALGKQVRVGSEESNRPDFDRTQKARGKISVFAAGLVRIGSEAFNGNDFDRAQKALDKATALCASQRPSVCAHLAYDLSYYLGRTLEARSQYADAMTEYDKTLKARGGNSACRSYVAAAMQRLSKKLGRVTVIKPGSKGKCLKAEHWLTPGFHEIRISATRTESVEVRAQQHKEIQACP